MHKPECVLGNEVHKLLWNFQIQTYPLISARRPNLRIFNEKKKTCRIVNFVVLADHRVKLKEKKKKKQYLDLVREFRKLLNMKEMGIPIVIGSLGVAYCTAGQTTKDS